MSKVIIINTGEREHHMIPNPIDDQGGGIEWQLRYGDCAKWRFAAADIVSTFDYLLSDLIDDKEAIRRIKIIRKERESARRKTLAL